MRHRAMFQTELSIEEVCRWLRDELTRSGYEPDGDIKKSKYDYEFSVVQNREKFSLSLFHNPSIEQSVCLYIKPKLGFFAAIRGKKDSLRELITTQLHKILSEAAQIKNPGWYKETQVWQGPTKTP